MVGDPIILDWRTWLRGMSSGTELDDGGFSPDTEGVNLISQPGVMHAPAASVDGDGNTTLAGEIVIHIPDNDIAAGGDSAALVSDTGRFYNCLKEGLFFEVEPFVEYREELNYRDEIGLAIRLIGYYGQ
ncbi:hypothetical protein LCGC14_2810320 [marine sediment metagenome]|uniref:Uncharacterized protein n=1 Tax=marine sediment metagenome TaxID=412755 RepID=A0A0F9ATG7_9ZZZZ